VLGHFAGVGLLGGEFALDEERALIVMTRLAGAMSKVSGRKVNAMEAAQGVLTVANTNMERALRQISIERGHDTRDFALLPFGGAGGLHAVELAQALRMPRIIVPNLAGALSAIGVVTADVVKDQSRTIMLDATAAVTKRLEQIFKEMERTAAAALRDEGFPAARQRHERSVALRYQGQSFELQVKYSATNLAASFHRAHLERYGYAQESNAVEIVSARVRSTGLVKKPAQKQTKVARKANAKPARLASAYVGSEKVQVAVYRRNDLPAGAELRTPCIVTEYSSTTLVPAAARAQVDDFGNLIIESSGE
jgi:N-methylhydantoinase A